MSFFFFSSRRRHTRFDCDWSSDVCSSDLPARARPAEPPGRGDADVPALAGGRGQVIRVVVDDLAFLACDAIVRPATTRLDPTTPMVRRLEQVGGTEFVGRLRVHKDLAVGSAVVTGGEP